ncbi:MAG: 30S ribosomal protein S27ae [Candidatus Micrarchaeota archaeon]
MAEEAKPAAAKKKKKQFKAYAKHRNCPKCGAQSHLAEHKDRLSCGKCGYMERR